MPTFTYTAIDAASGAERRGTVDGGNAQQAVALLKTRGLALMSLADASHLTSKVLSRGGAQPATANGTFTFAIGAIANAKELTIFTRQLATLIKAGMPLLRALEVLAHETHISGGFSLCQLVRCS